jgi:hypothetical protein
LSDAALSAYATRLRGLKNLARVAAAEAAPAILAAVQKTAAAGTDPEGKPWPPKRDGTQALPNVAGAITAVAKGAVVLVKLTGAYVFHHYAKGKDRRRILPDGGAGIPPQISEAVKTASERAFAKLMKS